MKVKVIGIKIKAIKQNKKTKKIIIIYNYKLK